VSRASGPVVRIRTARAADAGGVLALAAAFPTDRMAARSVRRFIAAQAVLVAARGPTVVGALVLLRRRNSRWARIYSVAVDPHYRGYGIGRRLILAAETRARRAACSGVSLEVRADNTGARALYAALGYHEVAHLSGYYEDQAPGIRLRKPFSLLVREYR
jgi:[ribosomal protein S18]-alanine N-acetyltransferase